MSNTDITDAELSTLPPLERIAKIKKAATKQTIIAAYEDYQAKKPGSLDKLFKVVLEFAQGKLFYFERNEHQFNSIPTASTFEDWAQEAAITIWQKLDTFEGDGANFFSWVHKIVFNKKMGFKDELLYAKRTRVPFMVDKENDEGESNCVENPEIYKRRARTFSYTIPKSIKGPERDICKLIVDGWSYARIARELGVSEDAIKSRVKRMRESIAKETVEEDKVKTLNLKRLELIRKGKWREAEKLV